MSFFKPENKLPQQLTIVKYIAKWFLIALPLGLVIGSGVALFLWMLNSAILYRYTHEYLLYFFPLIGVAIHFLYRFLGKSSEKGNNLIIDEIHQPGGGVPPQMGPLVLSTTVLTHLFGGSAGREGTAVQIGGSVAQLFAKWLKLDEKDVKTILLAGVAAGFGAVFGTPFTGAIFAIEVIAIGKIKYDAIIPCIFASLVGDFTVNAWQVKHTLYQIDFIQEPNFFLSQYFNWDIILLLKIMLASVVFGLASLLFASLVRAVKNTFLGLFKTTWLIPFFGGLAVILLTLLVGKPDYLSLGVVAQHNDSITISSAFTQGGADALSWLWKTIFTALTLGTGFKGGEVTPLFFIGATLGNILIWFIPLPIALLAGMGLVAVFSGATNCVIASIVLGIELFGMQAGIYVGLASIAAYFTSGPNGIYSAKYKTGAKYVLYYLINKFHLLR